MPPFLMILALAASVNLRAATVNLGTSRSLLSSVTVPTTTAILSLKQRYKLGAKNTHFFSPRCLTSLLIATGGLLILEETSLLRTVLAKVESVLLPRNLKSYNIKVRPKISQVLVTLMRR